MDVKTRYLNGELENQIFMVQPERFADKEKPEMVWKSQESRYGLKQLAMFRNNSTNSFLLNSDYAKSDADHCVYTKMIDNGEKKVIIAIYVDDVILASNDV